MITKDSVNFQGVITGFAGIRGSYELFVMNMNDYILKNGNISHNEFLLKSIEITQKLKRNDYEVLFGVSRYCYK